MHTKVLNLACLCLLLPFLAQAQRGLRVDSDRPGFGQTPITVGKHYLQMQVGQRGGWLDGSSLVTATYAEGRPSQTQLQVRFGLTNKTEVQLGATRMGFELNTRQRIPIVTPANWVPGLYYPDSYSGRWNNLQLGLRHTLMDEMQEKPFSLGLSGSYTQLSSADFSRNLDYPGNVQAGILGSKILSQRVYALGNIGLNQPIGAIVSSPNIYYLVNFAFDLGKNLGTFFETRQDFLTNDGGGNVSTFHTGLSWRLTPNFQFDLSGGFIRSNMMIENAFRINSIIFSDASKERYWFVGGGVSWKIKALPSKQAKAN